MHFPIRLKLSIAKHEMSGRLLGSFYIPFTWLRPRQRSYERRERPKAIRNISPGMDLQPMLHSLYSVSA